MVKVKVINVDPTGRIKLSRKALLEPEEGDDAPRSDRGGSDDAGDGDGRRRRRGGRKPAEAS
jgi:predicted RNA-binding protein with RPS1 domain